MSEKSKKVDLSIPRYLIILRVTTVSYNEQKYYFAESGEFVRYENDADLKDPKTFDGYAEAEKYFKTLEGLVEDILRAKYIGPAVHNSTCAHRGARMYLSKIRIQEEIELEFIIPELGSHNYTRNTD